MVLARADSGVETLERGPLDLVETLRDACHDGPTLAEAKRIDFEEQIPSMPIVVEGDHHALQRLFLILIDNAVKYTRSNGHITVSLAISDGLATVEVEDTGIGSAGTDLPHIFERFYRADKARSRELGGVGLGLSIGQWIAQGPWRLD